MIALTANSLDTYPRTVRCRESRGSSAEEVEVIEAGSEVDRSLDKDGTATIEEEEVTHLN